MAGGRVPYDRPSAQRHGRSMHWLLFVVAVLIAVAGGMVAWFEPEVGTWILLFGIFLGVAARFVQASAYSRRARDVEELLAEVLAEIRDIGDDLAEYTRGRTPTEHGSRAPHDLPSELQDVRRPAWRSALRWLLRRGRGD